MRALLKTRAKRGVNPIEYFTRDPALRAFYPLDDITGILARVINPYISIGRNEIINPDFASDTIWTKGTNWTIAGGLGVATAVTTGNLLSQGDIPSVLIGKFYEVTYTAVVTVGSVRVQLGSAGQGTTRSSSGTYTEILQCQTTQTIAFDAPSTFTGSVDNVSVKRLNIRPSTEYPMLNILENGNLDYNAAWLGTNWAVSAGKLTHTTGATSDATQTFAPTVIGKSYDLTYTVSSRTAGSVIGKVGTTGSGATRSTNATFTETIVAAGTTGVYFTPSTDFDGSINAISLVPTDGILMWDGDMEFNNTTAWTSQTAGTITKDTGAPHSGTRNMRIARAASNNPSYSQNCIAAGHTYKVTGWYKSDGSATPRVQNSGITAITLTTAIVWTAFEIEFVAVGGSIRFQAVTSTGTQYVEFDDIEVVEINPMTGIVSSTTIGQYMTPSILGYSFDNVNDIVNIFSAELNSAFDPDRGSILILMQPTNATQIDGTIDFAATLGIDANNELSLRKNSLIATSQTNYRSNSVTNSAVNQNLKNAPVLVVLTWDTANGYVSGFFNLEQGRNFQSVSPLLGNLALTRTLLGAQTTTTNFFGGLLSHFVLLNRPMYPDEVEYLCRMFGVV